MDRIIADRIIDPLLLVITVGLFISLWWLLPRLGVFVSALMSSLISAAAFSTYLQGTVADLPLEVDVLFARFIAALIQCGIVAILVSVWRQFRN
jgi:hypothetical protein